MTTTLAAPVGHPLVISAKQLADLLGCSTRHVLRQSELGNLPRPIRIGKLVRWTHREVEAWLAAQSADSPAVQT